MTGPPASWFRPMLAALALALSGAASGEDVAPVYLHIEWIDEAPDDGILIPDFIVAAHDGNLDFYETGKPVDEALRDAFHTLSSAGITHTIAGAYVPTENAVVSGMPNYPYPTFIIGVPPPGQLYPRRANLLVDPTRHRYFSFLASIKPSDDAFIGNDDAMRFELFDEDGRFNGPLVIELFGNQVIDAGLCGNDETDLRFLEALTSSECADGEGTVQPHPGLNGSIRNPDALPQRILGGQFTTHGRTLRYDRDAADFTVPGYRLGRLLVTRAIARWGHLSGSWYNPERAGEGFNLEVVEPAATGGPPRMLVYWYTFEPDGSGRQVWLAGMGELNSGSARILLHRTEGGRFASADNPDLVQREPWGHVDLHFVSCFDGSVRFTPLDPAWPEGSYGIHRLGPLPEGAARLCRPSLRFDRDG